jgi:hypothetical protein
MRSAIRHLLLGALCTVALAQTACPSRGPEAVVPDALPPQVRDDYEVFADRCSKCHALSRPLNSGIVSDEHWAMYVGRMRRQPGSGISPEDADVILRFLHYYSLEQTRKSRARESDGVVPDPSPAATPAANPPRLLADPASANARDAG